MRENDMSTNKLVRSTFDPTNPPQLTEAQRKELARIAATPDENIDYSDIPSLGEGFLKDAVRGKFYRPVKKQVTVRLDADVLEYFKAKQGGKRGYQTAINAALRKVVEDELGKAV
jgi:uncharacterized protein (DUF4415 family)